MFLVLLSLFGTVQAQDHAVLFVGNSYTFVNRPWGLDVFLHDSSGIDAWDTVVLQDQRSDSGFPHHPGRVDRFTGWRSGAGWPRGA